MSKHVKNNRKAQSHVPLPFPGKLWYTKKQPVRCQPAHEKKGDSGLKRNRNLLLWSALLSVLFIGLASKSSPIYPMNDWVDVNCFFTMGRGILDGMVPYRDLYEQKGPVLYFVYAVISLFSENSYFGVYLLEVVTYGLFLYFSGKLAELYTGPSRLVYVLTALLGAAVVTSWSFTHGGSVEQHSLFMLVYGMYSVLRAIRENRGLSFKEAFLNGIFAGMILWVKYTTLGFYLGLALFVLIWYLTDGSLRGKLLFTVSQFLLGIVTVTVPVLAYFAWNGAVGDLFTVYFYNNIFLYPKEIQGSRILATWDCLMSAIKNNANYGWMIFLGVFWLFLRRKNQWKAGLMTALCLAGLALGTYWGGRPYDYYGLVFAAFCVFGLIVLAEFLLHSSLPDLWHKYLPEGLLCVAVSLALVVSILLFGTLTENQNLYLAKYGKEDAVQYRFAKIIQEVDDPTLLNYGFLDGGFYFASGATPACRYFCYFNINPPEMWAEQNECIASGSADFIVTRHYTLDKYGVDTSRYQLVDSAEHPFDRNTTFTYYLYKLIS